MQGKTRIGWLWHEGQPLEVKYNMELDQDNTAKLSRCSVIGKGKKEIVTLSNHIIYDSLEELVEDVNKSLTGIKLKHIKKHHKLINEINQKIKHVESHLGEEEANV